MVKYRTIIGNLSDEVDYSSSEDVSMQINNVNNKKDNILWLKVMKMPE